MANALKEREAGFVSEDMRREADRVRMVRERQLQLLNLQRENILGQRTASPDRRSALEAALAQIEGEISAMG
jgi:hypothetical protein